MAKPDKKQQEPEKPKHPLMLDGKDWNRELVMNHICDMLSTTSYGIGSILKQGYEGKNLPTYSTFMLWLEEDKALSERYEMAKSAQADYMADELLEIADSPVENVVDQNGVSRKDSADVQHKRLRVDTRKWLAAKLKPKKYGERTTLAGDPDAPLNPPVKADLSKLSTAEIETLIALQKKLSGEQ